MPAFVAFLRAINVSGHAVVKMDRLQRAFSEAGCAEVRTVIQSGNVVFHAPGSSPAGLFQRVRENLRLLADQEVTIMFRKGSEIDRVVRSRPFDGVPHESDAKWYVSFLLSKPKVCFQLPLVYQKEAVEVLRVTGREAFAVSRRIPGKAMYGFPNSVIEKEFGIPATTRNWSTVVKVSELLSGLAGATGAKGGEV
jgi:uncharacterized protein (DUF1697 family)